MNRLPDQVLLDRTRARAGELGRPPGAREVYGSSASIRRWGSWGEALRAAGLSPSFRRSDEECLAHLRQLTVDLGRPPCTADLQSGDGYGADVIRRRFGGLHAACERAGIGVAHLSAKPGTFAGPLDSHLRRTFGLSEAEYWRMDAEQGGRCAICGNPETPRLFVDHDHESDEVRGLLCRACNAALGLFRDNPALLESARTYLLERMAIVNA